MEFVIIHENEFDNERKDERKDENIINDLNNDINNDVNNKYNPRNPGNINEYYMKNRDKKIEYQKEYNRKQLDKIHDYNREYYLKRREELLEKAKTTITCSCGAQIKICNKSTHLKTKKHMKLIEENEKINKTLDNLKICT